MPVIATAGRVRTWSSYNTCQMPAGRDRARSHTLVAIGGGLVFAASLALLRLRSTCAGFDAPPAPRSLWPSLPCHRRRSSSRCFALHHSMFARTGLKAAVARTVPPSLERSIYVWIASLLFIVRVRVRGSRCRASSGTSPAGLPGLLLARAGRRRCVHARRRAPSRRARTRRRPAGAACCHPGGASGLDDHGPYGLVRHPIYFAWLLLVWPAPLMNGTRLRLRRDQHALSACRDSVRGARSHGDTSARRTTTTRARCAGG